MAFDLGSIGSGISDLGSSLSSAASDVKGLFGAFGFGGWRGTIQQAKFRGQAFYTDDFDYEMCRRTVEHVFPFRDLPLVEDLGLGVQTLSCNAYLIGDDVYAQRDAFVKLAQKQGEGELIHPTLGSKTVVLTSASFSENKEEGRQVTMSLKFVVVKKAGTTSSFWQLISGNNSDSMTLNADDVNAAMKNDFSFKSVLSDIKGGVSQVSGIVKQATSFVGSVNTIMTDATRLVHTADGIGNILTGYTGSRFQRKATGSALSSITTTLGSANAAIGTVNKVITGTNSMINTATKSFDDVAKMGNNLTNLANLF